VGDQYRSVVFTTSPEQLATATASKERAQARFDKPIATQIGAAPTFYPAEGYHQRYYEGNGHTPYCHVLPVGVLKDLGLVPASS
jgi:peptide-methionine (S)-S-oxide reductase